MQFEITKNHVLEEIRDVFGHDIVPEHDEFTWALVKTDGTVLCRGPHDFADEKQARSQIAEAKKSMKGAMRCRVVTLDA